MYKLFHFGVLFFGLYASCLDADIFTWKDASGKTHYSDHDPGNSTKLQIKPGSAYHQVVKVLDGDTVVLGHGEKIRLLGINAPEMARRDFPAQAGAEAAKLWLQQQLKGNKVRLRVGDPEKDKYGRTLAHLFTSDEMHINTTLLQLGLAALNIFSPNELFIEQMWRAQQQAELQKKGIWGRPEYALKQIDQVNLSQLRGWQRLAVRVNNIRRGRKYLSLIFSDRLQAKIALQHLAAFPDLHSFIGKELEIRGWIKKRKQYYLMNIRHPSAMKLLE